MREMTSSTPRRAGCPRRCGLRRRRGRDKRYGELPRKTKLLHFQPRKERNEKIADYVNKKLTRLEKFYKYGLSQVGWNKYSYIDLEFDNQIICKKKKENKNNPE